MKLSDVTLHQCVHSYGRAASASAHMRPTCTSQAARRRLCGNGARSTSRLPTSRSAASAAPPSTAHALLSAAMLTAAGAASAAGAGVSDAPRSMPRGRRAFIEAGKVAGKGTPLHHWGSQKIKMHSRLCKALAGFMAIFPLRAMVLPNTPQSLRG